MTLRRLFSIIVLTFAVTLLFGCKNGNDTDSNENVIRVGMECDYAPFNWTETKSTETNVKIANVPGAYAEGYDVQVARLLADSLGKKLEVYAISWDGLVPALTSNQIDLIIAGMSPTEERKETIDFTTGYYRSTHVLLVKKNGSYANATNLEDFRGASVIGQTGTIYAELVSQVVDKGAVAGTDLDTVPEIVGAILNGVVDATILEDPVAKGISLQYPSELTYVTLTDGFVVAPEEGLVSIGVRKGFEETNAINEFLNTVLTDAKKTELMDNAIVMAQDIQ